MEAPEKIYIVEDRQKHEPMEYWYNSTTDDSKIEYIRKDALVKYLYEEKGYPITLNGELVHWDELNKHLAEYIKLKNDAFIEKACEWIKEKWDDNYTMPIIIDSIIEDFKNYMKGE